jgi:hypothetical protein
MSLRSSGILQRRTVMAALWGGLWPAAPLHAAGYPAQRPPKRDTSCWGVPPVGNRPEEYARLTLVSRHT